MDFVTVIPAPWALISLLILLSVMVLLVVGFAFNRYDPDREGRMPKATELPQSALLIVLTVITWITAAAQTPLVTLAALICIGMTCGFLGDLFMANVFNQKNHVLFGMGAFAVGHLLYILAFRQIAVAFDLNDLGTYAAALFMTWGLALILWFVLVRQPDGDSMQYAALGYALFLASMAGYALGLALQRAAFVSLAVGAALFLISDTLIAARLFGGRRFPFIGDAIWASYIAAQMLIVMTTLVAVGLYHV